MRQNKPSEQLKQREHEHRDRSDRHMQGKRQMSHLTDHATKHHEKNCEKKSNPLRVVWISIFLIYLYLLTKLILFKGGPVDIGLVWDRLTELLRQPDLIHTRTVNLTPFQEIKRDWYSLSVHHRSGTAIHLVGNILAFVPLGVLITGLLGHNFFTGIHVLILSFLLSLGYEGTQLLTGIGIFDVDDLMLNTFGGMIGYLLYTMLLVLNRLLSGGNSRVATNN
ncbi:VanZ family protein [Paenibacillus sp. TSA_86.1]|uniref:VanZ family protein n=1 Tax=Paenibacillus sp. TSA_86.1 TaxID=3415649 RepID=UPI0040466CD0